MTLQNRVDPWGRLHAVPERGTLLGNRGGKFHRDGQTLGRRRWASHHWICCELHYKDMHHEPMGHGYTSLFFLDEVTALAAGHRPCFFCRRVEAKAFLGDRRVEDFDRQLHAERLKLPLPKGEGGARRRREGEGTGHPWLAPDPLHPPIAARWAPPSPHGRRRGLARWRHARHRWRGFRCQRRASVALVLRRLHGNPPAPGPPAGEAFDSSVNPAHFGGRVSTALA